MNFSNPDFLLLRRMRALEARLQSLTGLVIAFSGGLDSRFLAHVAARGDLSPVLVHVTGPHVPSAETVWAELWTARNNFTLRRFELDPLRVPEVAEGRPDRCYYCKRMMFRTLLDALGPREAFSLCDGTNASDLRATRPGLRALAELSVLSPLAEAGLEKEGIRELARFTALERPGQRARPCLLTRFPYGLRVGREQLALLAEMEACAEYILRIVVCSYAEPPDFRIRLSENGSFTLQMDIPELRDNAKGTQVLEEALSTAFSEKGLPRVRMELTNAVSGYFDRRTKAASPAGREASQPRKTGEITVLKECGPVCSSTGNVMLRNRRDAGNKKSSSIRRPKI